MSGGSLRSKLLSPRGEFKKRSLSFRNARKTKSASKREFEPPPTPWEMIDKFINDNPDMDKGEMLDTILSDRLIPGSQESGDDAPFPGVPFYGGKSSLVSSTRRLESPPPAAHRLGTQSMSTAARGGRLLPEKRSGSHIRVVERNWPARRLHSEEGHLSQKKEELPTAPVVPARPMRPSRPEREPHKYPTLGKLPAQAVNKMLEIAATSHDQLRDELDGVRKELGIERELRMEKSDKVHELELANQRLLMVLERTKSFDTVIEEKDQLEADLHALELENQKLELELGWADPQEAENLRKKLLREKKELEERLAALVLADSELVESERNQYQGEIDALCASKKALQEELDLCNEKAGERKTKYMDRMEVLRKENQQNVVEMEKIKVQLQFSETEREQYALERQHYKETVERLEDRLGVLVDFETTIHTISAENGELYKDNQKLRKRLGDL